MGRACACGTWMRPQWEGGVYRRLGPPAGEYARSAATPSRWMEYALEDPGHEFICGGSVRLFFEQPQKVVCTRCTGCDRQLQAF